MKILVAEDDVISAMVLRKSLERLGHEVWIEPDGNRAWELLRGQQFRLLITDWMMPRMTGVELCRNIRERNGRPYTYIILVTVKSSPEDRALAMQSGIDDFLVKPIDPSDLVSRLEVAQRILSMKDMLSIGGLSQNGGRPEGKREIGAILMDYGAVTYQQVEEALDEQRSTGERIGEILRSRGLVSESDIARARAEQMDVPYIDIQEFCPAPAILEFIPHPIAQKYRILPISVEVATEDSPGQLRVAMENPWDFEAVALAERVAGYRIDVMMAAPAALGRAINEAYAKRRLPAPV